jgi:hypothetical protein
MRADEKFLSRWSRLKRESESQKARKTGLTENAALSGDAEEGVAGAETRAAPTFDPASLPSIESITADTDISMFLASGVPAKLTEAALRRAWVSDPVIRDFIGIAENQWDFTNPATIPGFGPVQEAAASLSRLAQTAGVPDRSLDGSSVRLPDTYAAEGKTDSPRADPPRAGIEDRPRETPSASSPRAVNREAPNAAPESGCLETVAQSDLSLENRTPRRRHAHGGALPR